MNKWQKKYKFLLDQVAEMDADKWRESEKAHRDLGEEAYRTWVAKYAKEFREHWEAENGPVEE